MNKKIIAGLLSIFFITGTFYGCSNKKANTNEKAKITEETKKKTEKEALKEVLDKKLPEKATITTDMDIKGTFDRVRTAKTITNYDKKNDISLYAVTLPTGGEYKLYKYHDKILCYKDKIKKYVDITFSPFTKFYKGYMKAGESDFVENGKILVKDLLPSIEDGQLKVEKVNKEINGEKVELLSYSSKVLKEKSQGALKNFMQFILASDKDYVFNNDFYVDLKDTIAANKGKDLDDIQKNTLKEKVKSDVEASVKGRLDTMKFGDATFEVLVDKNGNFKGITLKYDVADKGENVKFQYKSIVDEKKEDFKIEILNKSNVTNFENSKDLFKE